MRLYFDGKNGFFSSGKTVTFPGKARISLAYRGEGKLILENPLGTFSFPSHDGDFEVPKEKFLPGENRLFLNVRGKRYPVEGLKREGDSFTPTGILGSDLIRETALTLPTLISRMEAQQEEIRELQKKINGYILFK